MKSSFIFIAMMAYSSLAYSQSDNSDIANDKQVVDTIKTKQDGSKIYDRPEKMPSFPGGVKALMDYLSENIKYPAAAERKDIQGRVIVQYVVQKDGSITDVKVVKSVHPLLDTEAIRVTTTMPKWIPGEYNGNPVSVRYTMPITFKLQGKDDKNKKSEKVKGKNKGGHYNFNSDNFFQNR